MPNKTLSLAMVIFISLLAGASSFAVVLFPPENAKEEPKQEVARQPEQKTSPTVQAEKKTEPESETQSRQPVQRAATQREPQASKQYRRVNLAWKEIDLLAHMVQGEARGEPFIGKVAVASVVLNRLQQPNFPDTVAGIIYGAGEFCTVRDGQINLPPNADAYKAVELALGGWDPTYGALYFYNPARSSSRWIFTRPITVQYGQHVFAV